MTLNVSYGERRDNVAAEARPGVSVLRVSFGRSHGTTYAQKREQGPRRCGSKAYRHPAPDADRWHGIQLVIGGNRHRHLPGCRRWKVLPIRCASTAESCPKMKWRKTKDDAPAHARRKLWAYGRATGGMRTLKTDGRSVPGRADAQLEEALHNDIGTMGGGSDQPSLAFR